MVSTGPWPKWRQIGEEGQLGLAANPTGDQSRLMMTVGLLDQECGREECNSRGENFLLHHFNMYLLKKCRIGRRRSLHTGGELRVPQWKNVISGEIPT